MADDAEMTLIPSNTQPATGSAVAEPPKQDTTNIFGRFKKKLLFADETVVFFKVPAVALALTADCALAAEMPKDFQGRWCTSSDTLKDDWGAYNTEGADCEGNSTGVKSPGPVLRR